MFVKTHTTKRYILSAEDEQTLRRAAELLDNLYTVAEEHGDWESDFLRARDDIDDLLERLDVNSDGDSFWEEDNVIEEES
jgi:hypothetical protein